MLFQVISNKIIIEEPIKQDDNGWGDDLVLETPPAEAVVPAAPIICQRAAAF